MSSCLAPLERSLLLRVARDSLAGFLEAGLQPAPEPSSPALAAHRGAFVTLRVHATEELRGCRGESVARRPLVESVARMAIASGTDDPRFEPVTPDEVTELRVEISALTPLEPITPEEVEVGRHGLMIVQGQAAGLLLPQVAPAHGWSAKELLAHTCLKAGLPRNAWRRGDTQLLGFEAEVWSE